MVLDPSDVQPMPGNITFDAPDTVEDTPLTFGTTPPANVVPTSAIPSRAAKIDFTLGDASPGVPAISQSLQNDGDSTVKNILTSQQKLAFEQRKQQMITRMIQTQQGAVTNEQADFVRGMSQVDFNEVFASDHPLETAYARKYMNTVAASQMPKFQAAEAQHPEETNQLQDYYEAGVVRNEIIHKSIDDIQAQSEQQGWGSTIGDIIGSSFPLAGMRMLNAAKVPGGTSIDPGKSIEQQISYLHSLPTNEFSKAYKETLDNIPNLIQKAQFAKAMLSNSMLDSALSTGQNLLDVAGLGKSIGEMGAKALGKVAEGVAEDLGTSVAKTDKPGPGSRIGAEVSPFEVRNDASIPGKAANNNQLDDTVTEFKKLSKDTVANANDNVTDIPVAANDSIELKNSVSTRIDQAVIQANDNERIFNVVGSNDNLDRMNSLYSAAVDASKARELNLSEIAEKIGDFKTSTMVQLSKDEAGLTGDIFARVRQNAASINGGANKFYSDSLNLGREALKRMREGAAAREGAAKAILDTARIERDSLTNQVAANEALYNKVIRDNQIAPLQSSILDIDHNVKYTTEVNPETNVSTLSIYMGKPNGELFPNRLAAQKFVDDNLKFKDTKVSVKSLRGGYVAQIDHSVPDAINILDGLTFERAEAMTRLDRNGVLKGWLGAVRNQGNVLGTEQAVNRKTLTHGAQRVYELYNQVLEPYSRLKGQAMKELQVVQEAERDVVDYAAQTRGEYSQSVGEFQNKFYRQWKQQPTEAQIEGYYAYQQADALHFMVKEFSEVRDMERKGIKEFSGNYTVKNDDGSRQTVDHAFRGAEVDSLPYDDPDYDFRVAYKDPTTGEVKVTRKAFMNPDVRKRVQDIKDKGGKIIKIANQAQEIETKDGTKHVGFYVSDGLEEGRVTPDNNYRPGGHVMNAADHHIKQPIIKDGLYLGDRSWRAVEGEGRVAKNLAEKAEIARQMMNRNDPAFDDFVSKNLGEGMDGTTFRREFEDSRDARNQVVKGLDKDQPLVWTPKGKRTQDFITFPNGTVNTQENPYNMMRDLDRTFMGERDLGNIPSYYEEKGSLKLHQDGKLLNPAETIAAAGQNVVDRRLKADYITKSAQDWLTTYKDILEQPYEQLIRNPRGVLFDPQFKKGADLATLNNAKNARNSIMRFAGTGGADETVLESFSSKLGDWFYNKTGRPISDWVPDSLLAYSNNVPGVARSVAFHAKLGFFNPAQIFLQPQTFANILALSPKNAVKSIPAFIAMRTALLNPKMLEHSEGVMKAFGWKSGEFREMFDALLKTGWHEVKGSYGVLDTTTDGFFRSAVGKFLDAGTFFFDEGEKVNRLTSFATAYQDYRLANKGPLDNRSLQWILNRADNLTNNMSSANNAVWQKGIIANPAQFQTYNLRLMEQYLGKSLTGKEKAMLFTMHSALFGVPVAAGGAVGLWPVYQSVKQYLLDNDIPHDDLATQTVLNGIVQTGLKTAGYDNDFGERYGTGGASMLHDLLSGKDSLAEVLTGSSGGIMLDIFNTAIPGFKALLDSATGNPNGTYPLDQQTLMMPFRDISTVNNLYKMYYGMQQGLWMSKYGMAVDKVTDGESARSFLFGLTPERIKDLYVVNDIERGYKDGKNTALTTAADYWRRAQSAADAGDQKTFEYYNRMAKAMIVNSGGTDRDVQQALKRHVGSLGQTQLESSMRMHEQAERERNIAKGNLN